MLSANLFPIVPSRHGIACAGSWMVDVNCSIRGWPQEQTLATIAVQTRDGGGPGCAPTWT